MLNPRLRSALEVEEQRRQHARIDCRLQFQQQVATQVSAITTNSARLTRNKARMPR
jgi:hypothetical protein